MLYVLKSCLFTCSTKGFSFVKSLGALLTILSGKAVIETYCNWKKNVLPLCGIICHWQVLTLIYISLPYYKLFYLGLSDL